jgi:hypothetical protein
MRESTDPLAERIESARPGLAELVEEAERTWVARGQAAGGTVEGPRWRAFEDAFPTFYQFTNKPR